MWAWNTLSKQVNSCVNRWLRQWKHHHRLSSVILFYTCTQTDMTSLFVTKNNASHAGRYRNGKQIVEEFPFVVSATEHHNVVAITTLKLQRTTECRVAGARRYWRLNLD